MDTTSCRKYNTKCTCGFPRFPIWKTIISRPLNVSEEVGRELKNKYDQALIDVKEVLEDKEVIESILELYPKDQDTTLECYKINRKNRILKLLSLAGLNSDEDIQHYENALKG